MLSPKEQLFVQYYNAAGETFKNATKAAIAAGFSPKSAYSSGSRMTRKAEVREAIDTFTARLVEKLEISAENVLRELACIAFANSKDYFNPNGSPKEISALTREQAAAINSIKVNMTNECAVIEHKLHDKKASLELLGRHLKLFTDKVEVEVSDGLAESIHAGRQRVKGKT